MASFRRALSMPAGSVNQETHASSSASPLSTVNPSYFPRSFDSLDYTLCKVQTYVLGFFPRKSPSRPFERLKSKGNTWRRALFHFLLWFLLGIFIGFTPFASPSFSTNFIARHQAFSFEKLQQVDRTRPNKVPSHDHQNHPREIHLNTVANPLINRSKPEISSSTKLLIIVTPICGFALEDYYISRLGNTLRLVPPPLLWIVVEMGSQSLDMAELLRNSGVMFRHLICKENVVDTNVDRGMHMRNVVLSHIETHKLDGNVYFANYDNIYSTDLFRQMRQIRRFGTWTVAKVEKEETNFVMEGPICNGSQVVGWHSNEMANKFKRFHVELSGFAFNSSILWDPKRWHRPTLKPIRFLHTLKEVFQVSMFIGQIVEDESQMEGLPMDCSKVMVWQFNKESLDSFLGRKTSLLPIPYWFNSMKVLP